MRLSSIYAQFPYMRNFRIWNLHIYESYVYMEDMCMSSVYAQFLYMEFAHIRCRYINDVHIRKICTYRKVRDIRKICAYLWYMPNFRICAYLPYMHSFRIYAISVYGICAHTMQIHKRRAYTEDMHI